MRHWRQRCWGAEQRRRRRTISQQTSASFLYLWTDFTYSGRCGGSRASTGGTSVQRGTGDDVGGLGLGGVGVEVDVDTGVGVAVSTGERNELCGSGREATPTSDLELSAFGVELLTDE